MHCKPMPHKQATHQTAQWLWPLSSGHSPWFSTLPQFPSLRNQCLLPQRCLQCLTSIGQAFHSRSSLASVILQSSREPSLHQSTVVRKAPGWDLTSQVQLLALSLIRKAFPSPSLSYLVSKQGLAQHISKLPLTLLASGLPKRLPQPNWGFPHLRVISLMSPSSAPQSKTFPHSKSLFSASLPS